LRHIWKGIDHGVLKFPTDPLDFSNINILNRVAILIEANGAARSVGQFHLAKRSYQALSVLGVSSNGFEGALQLKPCYIGPLRVVRGDLLDLRLVSLHELLIDRVVQRGGVVERRDDSQNFVTHRSKYVFVGE